MWDPYITRQPPLPISPPLSSLLSLEPGWLSSGIGVGSPCHWYKSKKQGRGKRRERVRGTLLPVTSSLSCAGERVMAGYGLDKAVRASVSFDTPCGALLLELEVRFSPRRKYALVCLFATSLICLVLRIIWQSYVWWFRNDRMKCFLVSEKLVDFIFLLKDQSCRCLAISRFWYCHRSSKQVQILRRSWILSSALLLLSPSAPLFPFPPLLKKVAFLWSDATILRGEQLEIGCFSCLQLSSFELWRRNLRLIVKPSSRFLCFLLRSNGNTYIYFFLIIVRRPYGFGEQRMLEIAI